MGYRSCLALIRVSKRYGVERTEAACRRALQIGAPSRRTVEMILKNGLEHDGASDEPAAKPVVHENIRGGDYFDRREQNAETEGTRARTSAPPGSPPSHSAQATTLQCNLPFGSAGSPPTATAVDMATAPLAKKGTGYAN